MPVVGTAGHVDHGKSTLIRALTGRDPDRWEEEKRRGLTIDLGFSWKRIGEIDISFVDVPGHERFAKNMLAGIEAIDVALLVVAADEGWMPQSEEHLNVLDLLEIDRGVVAITKIDRVDRDIVELVTLEVAEKLEGTSLEGSEIIGVSAISGSGIDDLETELVRLARSGAVPKRDRPRMWIDRAFSITGAGTVVTGTLTGGPLSVDQTVAIWPGPIEARIRGLQSHEEEVSTAEPERRVAVNLAGLERSDIGRGAMLGFRGQWHPTVRIAVDLRPTRYVDEIAARGAFHIHIGSGGWPVKIRMIDRSTAIVDLPASLCLAMGDRFILRESGRRLVVGGGRVLDPDPRRGVSDFSVLLQVLDADPDSRAMSLLKARGHERVEVISAHSGGGRLSGVLIAGQRAYDPELVTDLRRRIEEMASEYHRSHPLRPGIGIAEVAEKLQVDPATVIAILDDQETIELEGSSLRRPDFTVGLDPDDEAAWQSARDELMRSGPEEPPRITELGLHPELVHALVRKGNLVQVSADFCYLPDHLEELASVIRSFESPFTVSEFKERAGISRKYAVPLLEWADDAGITVRIGDKRRLR